MYDIIIIGSGPAGMTAAIYSTRREMKTLVIGKETGGQMIWASEIENYPGFKSITSFELINKIKDHMLSSGAELSEDEVKKIEKLSDGSFRVYTNKGEFQAKTILVAMGLAPRRLAVKGELEFNGRGVSYCANCDGPLFKGKTVAVVGGGNSALDAAELLSKIASQVYLIHRSDSFRAFDTLVSEVKARENIEIFLNSEIEEIVGSDRVAKIRISHHDQQEITEKAVDGVFIEVGRLANTDLLEGLAERKENSQVIVDEKMSTTTPGLFAAGDVVDSDFKQITIAMGQATVAALSAYQYLQLQKGIQETPKDH